MFFSVIGIPAALRMSKVYSASCFFPSCFLSSIGCVRSQPIFRFNPIRFGMPAKNAIMFERLLGFKIKTVSNFLLRKARQNFIEAKMWNPECQLRIFWGFYYSRIIANCQNWMETTTFSIYTWCTICRRSSCRSATIDFYHFELVVGPDPLRGW